MIGSRLFWTLSLVTSVAPTHAGAQLGASYPLPVLSPAQCRVAVREALARPSKLELLGPLASCRSDIAPTIAALMKRYSLVRDTATYSRAFEIAAFHSYMNEIVDTAFVIAGDQGAPLLARSWSLVVLINHNYDEVVLDGRNYVVPRAGQYYCDIPGGSSHGPNRRTPWSVSRKAQSTRLTEGILASTAPPGLKALASCLRALDDTRWDFVGPLPKRFNNLFFPALDFEYVVQCGRRFLLRNKSFAAVAVTLWWGSTKDSSRTWTMSPRPEEGEGAPYSEGRWTAPPGDTLIRVTVARPDGGGALLMRTRPDDRPCN